MELIAEMRAGTQIVGCGQGVHRLLNPDKVGGELQYGQPLVRSQRLVKRVAPSSEFVLCLTEGFWDGYTPHPSYHGTSRTLAEVLLV